MVTPDHAEPAGRPAVGPSHQPRRVVGHAAAGFAIVGIPLFAAILTTSGHIDEPFSTCVPPQWTLLIDGLSMRVVPGIALAAVLLLFLRAARPFAVGVVVAVTATILLMVTATLPHTHS